MKIITKNQISKCIQSWSRTTVPDNYAIVPDDFDTSEFYAYNGFVDLTIDDANTVTAMTPNVEAWEAWQASLPDPEPEPEPEETPTDDELLESAIMEGLNYD